MPMNHNANRQQSLKHLNWIISSTGNGFCTRLYKRFQNIYIYTLFTVGLRVFQHHINCWCSMIGNGSRPPLCVYRCLVSEKVFFLFFCLMLNRGELQDSQWHLYKAEQHRNISTRTGFLSRAAWLSIYFCIWVEIQDEFTSLIT